MSNITIIELAERLGLSKSTVSRAFRDGNDINPNTKARILKMADELGFSPNMYASNLRANKSSTIAIIIPEFGNKFFSQAIKGIELVARSKNYHTLIYVTDHRVDKEASIIRSLINGRVDGVIMSASGEGHDHSHLQVLKDNNIPVVFFDRTYDDVNTSYVTGNDFEASFAATEHLIENDCRRIAYLVINQNVSIGKVRMAGYQAALEKYKIPFDTNLVLDTVNESEGNMEDIKNLYKIQKPDGLFASVERLAISAMRVAKDQGINIPSELKLICFSCLDIADLLEPGLSVVKQPAYEMGKTATEYLCQLIAKPISFSNQEVTYLESSLIFQKSSEKNH